MLVLNGEKKMYMCDNICNFLMGKKIYNLGTEVTSSPVNVFLILYSLKCNRGGFPCDSVVKNPPADAADPS